MKQPSDFTDNYRDILSEQLISEMKAMNEGITGIQQKVDRIEATMATKDDIKRLERHLYLHDVVLDEHASRLATTS